MKEENKIIEDNKELLGFEYDKSAKKTRTIKKLLKDKKGICFDFVNYLYHKYNKTGKCYFIWFNNKEGNTHTIYITESGYYIEATPPTDNKLKEIYVSKVKNINDIVKDLAKQFVTMYWKNSPKYRVCEYTPEDVSEEIETFIDKRWEDGGFDNFSLKEEFRYFNY